MKATPCYAALSFMFALSAGPALSAPPLAKIVSSDNRTAAGTLSNGTLRVTLVARRGLWYPDGPEAQGVPVEAFGEPGKPLQIPGPLVRVPAGTTIVATLRNGLGSKTLHVHDLSADVPDIALRPGEQRTVRFTLHTPGTYGYWATDAGESFGNRFGVDALLAGAIVVDDARRPHPADRVFVIDTWVAARQPDGSPNFRYELEAINGRSWPATERLNYNAGDLVRWHIFNAGFASHPMHLHGYSFTLEDRGDGRHSVAFTGDRATLEDTELVDPGETYSMHFRPDRAGMWMYHCHIAAHTVAHAPLAYLAAGRGAPPRPHTPEPVPMGGLVLAVNVMGPAVSRAPQPSVETHRLTLDVRATGRSVTKPFAMDEFAYALQDRGENVPAMGTLGPAIVLTAGEPVAIAITNHLNEPTSVHWHGIAVQDSYDDGSANMRMDPMPGMRAAPAIEPGGSFVAHFTPPTAGTYAYHTHMNDFWQMLAGLSGPLIVLPPGERFDPATDHIVMVTSPLDRPLGDAALVNGEMTPAPIVVHVGVPQRFRLINFTFFNADLVASLAAASSPLTWTPLAVDGNALPASAQTVRPAVQGVTIGQTRDFSFTASAPGHATLGMFDTGTQLGAIPIDIVP